MGRPILAVSAGEYEIKQRPNPAVIDTASSQIAPSSPNEIAKPEINERLPVRRAYAKDSEMNN